MHAEQSIGIGARNVMVIVVGNGHGDTISNPAKLGLKIDLVSDPARAEGLVNMIGRGNSCQIFYK